jgi:hypothetical protein
LFSLEGLVDGLQLQGETVSRERFGSCPECSRFSEQYEEALDQYKALHSQWREAVAGKHVEISKAILLRVPPMVDAVKQAQTALEEHHKSAHPAQDQRENLIEQDRRGAAWYPTKGTK